MSVKYKLLIGFAVLNLCVGPAAIASDLDAIKPAQSVVGTSELLDTQDSGVYELSEDSNVESAESIKELFKVGGLTEESVAKSKKWVEPIVKIVNYMIALLVGFLAIAMSLTSVLDLVYLQVPSTRAFLCPKQIPSAPGIKGNGSMQPTGAVVTSHKYISDEAEAALQETQAEQGSQFIIGQPQKVGGKSALLSYLKKRSFTLVLLGVCLVLLTCTIFTDIGITLGTKALSVLSGI